MTDEEIKKSIIDGDALESGKGYSLSWALATAFVLLNNETVFDSEEIENLLWDRICELMNRKNNGWISVDERLPNKDGWYLVYFRFLCEIKKFSNGEWQNQRLGSKITHWQPLPQPPFIIRMEDLKDE